MPQGMGVILRTAGESRTKAEIKRDYEYLMRLWENVRNLTLQSTAPALVYEEGSLIKRSVRDLYNKDIDEILVAGEDGYREAKDFMRMLMPSHAKVVQPYRDTVPIFARNGIEAQLDRMLQPQVTLKSGGYIIINQTEALVSIDVNSGRSTKEHSIEDTALQTNLEAAEEVARQLRLRDLAGLIVIDFIDMEENRNNRAVEKRLKDCLKNDRARIQVGRISHFGLLEMSRQRIRASVLESTMKPCPHCGGTGHVRSDSSVALHVVRAIEEFLLKDSRNHITVKTPTATALYVLNHKRSTLVELERRFGVTITLEADETLGAQHYAIFRGAIAEKPAGMPDPLTALPSYAEPEDDADSRGRERRGRGGRRAACRATGPRPTADGQADHNRDRKRRRRRGGAAARIATRAGRTARSRRTREAATWQSMPARRIRNRTDDDDGFEDDSVEARDDGAEADASPPRPTAIARSAGAASAAASATARRGRRAMRLPATSDAAEAEPGEPTRGAFAEPVTEAEAPAGRAAKRKPAAGRPSRSARRASRRRLRKRRDGAEAAAAVAEACRGRAPVPAPAQAAEPNRPSPQRRHAGGRELTRPAETPRPSRRKPASENAQPAEPVVVSTAGAGRRGKPKKAGWWQRKGFF